MARSRKTKMSNKKNDQVAECCTTPKQSNGTQSSVQCKEVYVGEAGTLIFELTKVLNGTGEFKDNKEFKKYLINQAINIIAEKDAENTRLEIENMRLRKQCECLTAAICDAETRCENLTKEKTSRDVIDYSKYTRERLERAKEKGYEYGE